MVNFREPAVFDSRSRLCFAAEGLSLDFFDVADTLNIYAASLLPRSIGHFSRSRSTRAEMPLTIRSPCYDYHDTQHFGLVVMRGKSHYRRSPF